MNSTSKIILTTFCAHGFGVYRLGEIDGKLCLMEWVSQDDAVNAPDNIKRLCRHFGVAAVPGISPILEKIHFMIEEYLAGKRREFEIDCILVGTPFQKKVWEELKNLSYGNTISYSQLAFMIGEQGKQRAVASALRHNPVQIIYPCHRVIGANGSLTGFAAGLDMKSRLLDLEKINK